MISGAGAPERSSRMNREDALELVKKHLKNKITYVKTKGSREYYKKLKFNPKPKNRTKLDKIKSQ